MHILQVVGARPNFSWKLELVFSEFPGVSSEEGRKLNVSRNPEAFPEVLVLSAKCSL